MKSVAIVLGRETALKELYVKTQAKRYYADLNVKVYYFKSHSQYWINFLSKLEIPLVAIDSEVSNRLTELGLPHSEFKSTTIKEHLINN